MISFSMGASAAAETVWAAARPISKVEAATSNERALSTELIAGASGVFSGKASHNPSTASNANPGANNQRERKTVRAAGGSG